LEGRALLNASNWIKLNQTESNWPEIIRNHWCGIVECFWWLSIFVLMLCLKAGCATPCSHLPLPQNVLKSDTKQPDLQAGCVKRAFKVL
jgi:hypothetical protein